MKSAHLETENVVTNPFFAPTGSSGAKCERLHRLHLNATLKVPKITNITNREETITNNLRDTVTIQLSNNAVEQIIIDTVD